MILINGNWEIVEDLYDILRVVEENIGSEFADKIKEVYSSNEYIEELKDRIQDLEDDLDELELYTDECDGAYDRLDELNLNLDKLNNYIKNFKCTTEFDKSYLKGLTDAYVMVY